MPRTCSSAFAVVVQNISRHQNENRLPDEIELCPWWADGQSASVLVPRVLPHGLDALLEPVQVLVHLHGRGPDTLADVLPRRGKLGHGVAGEQGCDCA